MCVIYGTLFGKDQQFYDINHKLAVRRGRDPVSIEIANGKLFHYRIATNQSTDQYPVLLDGQKIAMNGIVSQSKYDELVKKFGDIGYTVDTAYLLKELQQNGFSALDTSAYVFAFWLVQGDNVVLANKDYPMFIKREGGKIYFSSFPFDNFERLGNRAIEVNTKTKKETELYQYKDLIYGM